MSDILYDMLVKRFPPLGSHDHQRITTYPHGERSTWIERIHLELIEEEFMSRENRNEPLADAGSLEKIAKEIFDIHFEFKKHFDDGAGKVSLILFEPGCESCNDKYKDSYSNQDITIRKPFDYPKILFSTGNRGSIALHPMQREKYFLFAEKVYLLFKDSLKKSKI